MAASASTSAWASPAAVPSAASSAPAPAPAASSAAAPPAQAKRGRHKRPPHRAASEAAAPPAPAESWQPEHSLASIRLTYSCDNRHYSSLINGKRSESNSHIGRS